MLILAPWNFPIRLALLPLAAALAAGNVALVKPSEKAPNCAALVRDLIHTFLDAEAIAVVEGDGKVAASLLEHKFDHIFYTGSESAGRQVYAAAARHLTPVTLELGGKNACYVHSDVDIEVTARRLLHGALVNCGQMCLGLDLAYVHTSVLRPLIAALKTTLKEWYGDNPRESKSLGRLITSQHTWRLQRMLELSGAEIIVGGDVDVDSKYFAPTIVLEPLRDSALRREESFGPFLVLVVVQDMDEAIRAQRNVPTPLCKYVFANDGKVAKDYMARVKGGMGCINDTMFHAANPEVPFGGLGQSGFGAYHGMRGVIELSHICGTLHQPLSSLMDPPFRYPPYTDFKMRILAFVLRYPGSDLESLVESLKKRLWPLLKALLLFTVYRRLRDTVVWVDDEYGGQPMGLLQLMLGIR